MSLFPADPSQILMGDNSLPSSGLPEQVPNIQDPPKSYYDSSELWRLMHGSYPPGDPRNIKDGYNPSTGRYDPNWYVHPRS